MILRFKAAVAALSAGDERAERTEAPFAIVVAIAAKSAAATAPTMIVDFAMVVPPKRENEGPTFSPKHMTLPVRCLIQSCAGAFAILPTSFLQGRGSCRRWMNFAACPDRT